MMSHIECSCLTIYRTKQRVENNVKTKPQPKGVAKGNDVLKNSSFFFILYYL